MSLLRNIPALFTRRMGTAHFHWLMLICVFGVGVAARTWEYGTLPPSLFPDEASIGIDSYYIGHYGIDRNGISYPTQLIAFGQEQNALYAYLTMPLIAVLGLRPIVIRLPVLVSALLTLPLVYVLTRRMFNPRVALVCTFFLAISPWHILMSRWGLDQNLLPFVFSLAVACLAESIHRGGWLVAACFLFGLCFYIYGPSYFIVPFVLGFSIWLLWRRALVNRKIIAAGIGVFCVLAIPISAFIVINALRLPSLRIGPVTIPEVPSTPRFLSQTGTFHDQPIQTLVRNLGSFSSLLFGQTDGLIYNAFEPFGYFYKITFPFAILGIVLLYRTQKSERDFAKSVLFLWVLACLLFGVLQPVNINRINTLFIPLLICTAVSVDWLGSRSHAFYGVMLGGLLIAFVWFTVVYHGPDYRTMIRRKFHEGILPAIAYASSLTAGPLCVTDKIDMPYIYVLFQEKPDPRAVVHSIEYVDPSADLRAVRSLTRYTFGSKNCSALDSPVYVLTTDEIPPSFGKKYAYEFFDEFVVYYPKP